MSATPSTDPPHSHRNETRWFRWMIACTAGLCLGVVTWVISGYLSRKLMLEIHATMSTTPGPGDLDYLVEKLAPIRSLATTTGALFLVFGLGFLFCLTKWLLAIRRRRAAEAESFSAFPPAS